MEKKNICFSYGGKKIELEVQNCDSLWSKFRGLMFRNKENASALLFDFKKSSKISIHSFFCHEFIAVWLNDKDKVIRIKKIKPWRLNINPKQDFAKLIEIPVNNSYFSLINQLSREY